MNKNKLNYKTLQVGRIITYKLLLRDKPVNPDRIWTGRILRIYTSHYCGNDVISVSVEILDPGFVGETEMVMFCQIETSEEDSKKDE
jgi:hypothetical protein